MTDDSKRIAIVCGTCGSDEVSRDAWAEWDIDSQKWELRSVFDHAHCHRCDCEARLLEVELELSPSSRWDVRDTQKPSPPT